MALLREVRYQHVILRAVCADGPNWNRYNTFSVTGGRESGGERVRVKERERQKQRDSMKDDQQRRKIRYI